MRKETYDGRVWVRAPSWLLAEAERKAEREGMNLSELVRSAIRRELRDPTPRIMRSDAA